MSSKTCWPPFVALLIIFSFLVTIALLMNLFVILASCRQLATLVLALGGNISISLHKINTVLYTWVINLVFHTLVYYAIQALRKNLATFVEIDFLAFLHYTEKT